MLINQEVMEEFRIYLNGRYSDRSIWSDSLIYETLFAADFETAGSGWGDYYSDNTGGIQQSFKKRGMFLYATAYLTAFYGNDPSNPVAGDSRLNVAAKSVGDESIQYRVSAMQDAGNDFLTYTMFGQEFFRIRKFAYLGARSL